MSDSNIKEPAFKLKGRLYTLTVLQLLTNDMELIKQHLISVVLQAPRLFEATPVIIDFSLIYNETINFQDLLSLLKEQGLVPIGLQGGNPFVETIANVYGLPILNASASNDKSIMEKTPIEEPLINPAPAPYSTTKLWTALVRSGQQVVSQDGDLVVTSSVSHGSELLAEGNIHIYGALRGRALAGIGGNKEARIFCMSLEAELVSIAGIYRLSDALEHHSGPCQLFIHDNRLLIEPIRIASRIE